MIQPITNLPNTNNYYKKNINFKNTAVAAPVSSPAVGTTEDSSILLKYMEEKDKKEKIDKRNGYIFAGVITAATIGTMAFMPKMIKKVGRQTSAESSLEFFKSLNEDKKIPTLDTCKSINSDLKKFLENQVMFAKATTEQLNKTGAPESANRLLMCGEPGSGKTFFAKIFAKTLGADYMEIKYSDLNKRFVGDHLEHIKSVFDGIISHAEKNPDKKFVVNFNEIEALVPPLEQLQNGSGGHTVFKQEERNVLLTYIEELAEKTPNVTLIGSSNTLPGKGIDGAFVSRFQNVIEVKYPEKDSIFEALKAHIEQLPEGKDFIEKNSKRLEEIAQKMRDRSASFRNLNNVMNESKNIYLRNVMKDNNSNYKCEYIEEALNGLNLTDGEITKMKGMG